MSDTSGSFDAFNTDLSGNNDLGENESLRQAVFAANTSTTIWDDDEETFRKRVMNSIPMQLSLGMFDEAVAVVYLWIALHQPIVDMIDRIGDQVQSKKIQEGLAREEREHEFTLFTELSKSDPSLAAFQAAVHSFLVNAQGAPVAVTPNSMTDLAKTLVVNAVFNAARPIKLSATTAANGYEFEPVEGTKFGAESALGTVQKMMDAIHGHGHLPLVTLSEDSRALLEIQILADQFLTKDHVSFRTPDNRFIENSTQWGTRVLHFDPAAAATLGVIRSIAAKANGLQEAAPLPTGVRITNHSRRQVEYSRYVTDGFGEPETYREAAKQHFLDTNAYVEGFDNRFMSANTVERNVELNKDDVGLAF